jgi:hypothetical protein
MLPVEELWLNVANVALGAVVLGFVTALAVSLLFEGWRHGRRALTVRHLDRELRHLLHR